MITLSDFSKSCHMTAEDTAAILKEAGINITSHNEHITENELLKLPAYVAKIALSKALTIGGADCATIVKSKCPIIWKGCPDTRAEFGGDYDIFEAYYDGMARGQVGSRVTGGTYNVH